jgi:hypothetical protein
MIYQSLIYKKGTDKPIPVSKAAAEAIKDIFTDTKIAGDHPINLGNKILFTKSQIKGIEILPDLENPVSEEAYKDFYAEEKKNHVMRQKWSVEVRAKQLHLFTHLYEISTGDQPSADTLESARISQLAFFIKNSTRTVCDPSSFKHLIPMVRGAKISIWQSAFFNLVERYVYRDIQLSK